MIESGFGCGLKLNNALDPNLITPYHPQNVLVAGPLPAPAVAVRAAPRRGGASVRSPPPTGTKSHAFGGGLAIKTLDNKSKHLDDYVTW